MDNMIIRKPMVNPIIRYDEQGKEIKEKRNPENKQYLLLICFINSDERTFEVITGRTAAREYVVQRADEIDINKSMIIVESKIIEEAVSIYEFMKHMELYFNDGFDIEDYNESENLLVRVDNGAGGYDYVRQQRPREQEEYNGRDDDGGQPESISNFDRSSDEQDV